MAFPDKERRRLQIRQLVYAKPQGIFPLFIQESRVWLRASHELAYCPEAGKHDIPQSGDFAEASSVDQDQFTHLFRVL